MLINDQPARETLSAIIMQLNALPSSFPEYYMSPVEHALLDHQLAEQNSQFNAAYQQSKNKNFVDALASFESIENTIEKNRPQDQTLLSGQLLAAVYKRMAWIHLELGRFAEAEQNYDKRIVQLWKFKDYWSIEETYQSKAALHRDNKTIQIYEEKVQADLKIAQQNKDQFQELNARLALGGIYRMKGEHKAALEHYAIANSLKQGRVDYEAARVEQHEVGFSSKQKIGTDNILQCVVVILRDPVTKKTALAHVDKFTDVSCIDDIVARFPSGTKLEAHLVGGTDKDFQQDSDKNIKNVITALQKHDVINIKSADIATKGAPRGIVFDPNTGKLEHVIPGKVDPTTAARQAQLQGILKASPLVVAFDFTKSEPISGPQFSITGAKLVVKKYMEIKTTSVLHDTGDAETSHASSYDALARTVENIRYEKPEIIESVIREQLNQKNSPLSTNNSIDPAQTIEWLMTYVHDALRDTRNDIFTIRKALEDHVAAINKCSNQGEVIQYQNKHKNTFVNNLSSQNLSVRVLADNTPEAFSSGNPNVRNTYITRSPMTASSMIDQVTQVVTTVASSILSIGWNVISAVTAAAPNMVNTRTNTNNIASSGTNSATPVASTYNVSSTASSSVAASASQSATSTLSASSTAALIVPRRVEPVEEEKHLPPSMGTSWQNHITEGRTSNTGQGSTKTKQRT